MIIYEREKVTLGGDPEFFFEKGGEVIGAEKVLKVGGKEIRSSAYDSNEQELPWQISAYVLDGVQVEINFTPQTCRRSIGLEVGAAFRALKAHLAFQEGVRPNFSALIEIGKAELDSLSDAARALGCEPSHNLYDQAATVTCDGASYLSRSAGGHIHLGFPPPIHTLGPTVLFSHREELVPLLDILLANTCVLLDRDPGNVERRKQYGRAGEYRLPPHGLEYRTLSNFWLRANPLLSFVMGLARFSCAVLYSSLCPSPNRPKGSHSPTEALFSLVDIEKVKRAINTNDASLARETFDLVQGWFTALDIRPPRLQMLLSPLLMEVFLQKVEEKGLEFWFPEDPLEHWAGVGRNGGKPSKFNPPGWERFLSEDVGGYMEARSLEAEPPPSTFIQEAHP